jgi:hypothetical protein
MKKSLGICKTCKGPVTRQSKDKICGKCYLQKRKQIRDKINKEAGKKLYFEEKFWF